MRAANGYWLVAFIIAFGVLGSACSNADDPDAAVSTDKVNSSTDRSAETVASPSTSPTPALPDWVSSGLDEQQSIRYVANTGGVGVSHRSACAKDARLDGVWSEGTELEIVLESDPACADWSLLSDGEITSWVQNQYLSITEPVVSSRSGGGGASSIQVLVYQQWQLPISKLRILPAADTWCETDSWHDASGTNITETIDGAPFANPDARGCGFGSVATTPVIWVSVP